MMIDWTTIFIGIIGLFNVGGIGTFLYFRANKGSATADAIEKAADAMKKMLDNVSTQQEMFNKIVEQKDEIIEQRNRVILDNEQSIAENKRLINEQSYHLATHARQLKGLQREVEKKKHAERLICFKEECGEREPQLGTFKTDTHYTPCDECGKKECKNCKKETTYEE